MAEEVHVDFCKWSNLKVVPVERTLSVCEPSLAKAGQKHRTIKKYVCLREHAPTDTPPEPNSKVHTERSNSLSA